MAEPRKASTRARPAPVDRAAREKRAQELATKDLSDMFGLGDPDKPPRVFVHGEKGIGKTGFFANVPGVVFLAMEQGIAPSAQRYKGSLETYDDLVLALEFLAYGKHPFKFAVLETAAEIDRRIVDRIEARLRTASTGPQSLAEVNEQERGAGYNLIADEWQILIDLLNVIWGRGIGWGLTAHTRATTVAGLHGGPDYQRYEPQFTSSTRARGLVAGAVDAFVYLATDVSTSKNAQTGKVTALLGRRWMHFHQEATHDAKCRGRVPWPRRVPLDVRRGWRDFATLYDLITRHGEELPAWLFHEACEALKDIPGKGVVTAEQRRAGATRMVAEALETFARDAKGDAVLVDGVPQPKEPDYLLAWSVVEQARAEGAEARAAVKAAKAEAKGEVKAEAKGEVKAEAKGEVKAEAKAETANGGGKAAAAP